MRIVTEPDRIEIPKIPGRKAFPTLTAAYNWAAALVNAGLGVQVSRLRQDFFKNVRPRDNYFKVLGVANTTDAECKRVEPDGEWRVEIENPGTGYEKAGIFGPRSVETKLYRFSAWYSRFLPYAVGMLMAEHGYGGKAGHLGIDFDSINSYYGTCYGFIYLGQGDGQSGEYHRIDPGDVALFEECYTTSCNVMSPSLPFEEALHPCIVYVACFQPWRIAQIVDKGHWWREHVAQCFEVMHRPQPDYRKSRRTQAA